jgi:8-oxo-dGTP diphosphatase
MGKARKKSCYEYPRPAVTVDVVLVTAAPLRRVLLIKRRHDPFAGKWALPGGFVDEHEDLAAAARRELREETHLEDVALEQLHTFGAPGRDPRGHTVSVVYLAEVDAARVKPRAGDDAAEVEWHALDQLPPLAFDHANILALARRRLSASG